MQEGTIVRVFVASPSDAIPLSDIAKGAVDDWNATYAYDHRIMLEVVRGSTHAKLALGAHPQDTISKFLIHKCDFLFGIFRHRIGSPTETSASGTIQEIEDFCQSHPPSRVKMFFSNEDIPQDEHEQFLELKTFKEFTKKKGLYCDFRDGEDLRGKLTKQLGIEMSEIIKNLKSSATHGFHHDAEWYNQSYNTTIRHINGREWVEVDSSGAIRFKLVEVASGQGYVELYNETKNEMWRISETTMHGRKVAAETAGLASGRWRKANNGGS